MKQLATTLTLLGLLLALAAPAHAESKVFTVEVAPGVAGAGGLDSFGIGGSATFFIFPTDVISLGLRPEFDWQKRDNGHDFFLTANVQVDITASKVVVPSAWIGVGMKQHTHSGLDFDTFLSTGGQLTQGTLGLFTSGKIGRDGTGVAYNFGGQIKFVLADPFYVGPTFSFLHGSAKDNEDNHYRLAIAAGLAF